MPEFEKQKNPNQSDFLARSAVRGRSMPKPAHDDNPLLAQQQALGNQAMQRFAQSCPLSLPSASICPFGGVCHTCPVQVQTKLKINQPGDKYEQEADQVADEVMRMSDLNVSASSQSEGVPPAEHIQRLCPECEDELQRQPEEEEEELLQAKPLSEQITPLIQRQVEEEEEEEEELQAKPVSGQTPHVSSRLQAQIGALRGGGQPLPQSVRNFFEQRFGRDLSDVRVHTDTQAAKAARSIYARAFTKGRDVVFGSEQYAPGTVQGKRLLAHELTHVLQQDGGGNLPILRRWSYGSGAPADPTYIVVPNDEKARVEAGLKLVKRVSDNPKSYPRCHKRFKNLCTSPGSNELLTRYNAAKVWKETSTDPKFRFGSSVSPDHIAYTAETWRWGRWMLASTLLHEMMHRCGYHNESEILKTERICGLPGLP